MATASGNRNGFEPDYAVPPGATLLETIAALGMDQKELATRLGFTQKHVSQVANGHVPLSYEMADKLELVTGVPARIWNNLEMNYQERLVKLAATKRLESDLVWLKRVPTKELIRRGKIERQSDKTRLLRSVLSFFGVSGVEAWDSIWTRSATSFRRSACFAMKPEATAAWLRFGELEAINIQCQPFDKSQFKAALDEIRKLTVTKPEVFRNRMVELCAGAGVALVFVPAMEGCPASGAARWLTPQKAIVQLSLRHKTDDHFWFSFFHEAAHILKDPKKGVYIDDGSQEHDKRETQANAFARDFLIPSSRSAELGKLRTGSVVERFAESIGIAPGIVVGCLQHDGLINHGYLNHLKQKFEWSTS